MKPILRIAAGVAAWGLSLLVHAAGPVEVFSPQGTAKAVRQVTARFATDQVALGEPTLPDPFEVDCPAPGKGRWVDTRQWAWDFEADLPGGLVCQFTLKADPQVSYRFDTGGPVITGSFPADGWLGVDEEQVFLLKLDAAVTNASVREHARCLVDGIGEAVPVEVLEGAARQALLNARRALGYQYFSLLWKDGEETGVRVRDRSMESAEATLVALRCQRRLPPSTAVQLLWGRGIATPAGVVGDSDQRLAFKVRPAFTLRAECTRTRPDAGCVPLLPLRLGFSAPVPRDLALAVRLKLADGRLLAPVSPPADADATLEDISFDGPFAEQQTVQLQLPPQFRDDAGRSAENAARFPLDLQIDALPPLAKFAGAFGILEAREGGVLPVTLRNLEASLALRQTALPARSLRVDDDPVALLRWLARVQDAGRGRGEYLEKEQRWREDTGNASVFTPTDATQAFELRKPEGGKAFEVVGIPLRENGLHIVEIESRLLGQALLGRDESRYVATAALVTDLAVHFKWGRESSLVWVTRLSDGQPVPQAQVSVSDGCKGATLWRGSTDGSGLAFVQGHLGRPHGGTRCNDYGDAPLVVVARVPGDYGFAVSGWNDGIEPWQFGVDTGGEYAAQVFHTVTDRALFRSGETVSMKHFLRRRHGTGLVQVAQGAGKRALRIVHEGSDDEFAATAVFGKDGVAESAWTVPEGARLGRYQVQVQDGPGWRSSGSFRVAQFRLPTMTASVSGPARALVQPRSAELDLRVAYLSGGGAAHLPVKLRTQLQPAAAGFSGYEGFVFGGEPVTVGVSTEDGNGYDLDFEAEPADAVQQAPGQLIPVTLDGAGTARVAVPDLPTVTQPQWLVAELEYPDANGELLTASTRLRLLPAARAVGLRTGAWNRQDGSIPFEVVVVDAAGQPVAAAPVTTTLYQQRRFSFRKRLVGGFYGYQTSTEVRELPVRCEGQSDAQGRLQCRVKPGANGEILLRAEVRDEAGRLAGSTSSVWVYGEEDSWFGGDQGDRMDLLPERPQYESGQNARLQVRMPFRRATALVTVEREGVLSGFVTTLEGREPVVEVPLRDAHAPNVFVSVLAVRGRVASARGEGESVQGSEVTALIDLNKPSWRLGIAPVKVGWTPNRLDVQVQPAREVWRIRERAAVRVKVARANGKPLPAGAEVALAAVDSALLQLAPNDSWKLLEAMMGERGLEVQTATAQMQVVGKRHFGRKAVPVGGGGGLDRAREDFSTLLLWRGRVQLDANGEALLEIPLNDSLSEFRIVAVAHAGASLFGTGSATLRTTQDLILLAGLPPVVREGDQFLATFTVRNTTQRVLTAEVTGRNQGAIAQPLSAQRVELQPGQGRDIAWRVTAPVGVPAWRWEVAVRDLAAPPGAAEAGDAVRVTQRVVEALPVRVQQATLQRVTGAVSLPVQRPAAALPGRGGLTVTLRPRIGDGLDGVRSYFERYRYSCLEQQLSRSVGLNDRAAWDAVAGRLAVWQDGDGLLRYFADANLPGDDSLTAYVLSMSAEAGWPLDPTAAARALEGLRRFVQGRVVRYSAVPTADLAVRKLAAIEALARYDQAEPAMLDSLVVAPERWPTSALLDYVSILQRLEALPQRDERLAQALGLLRSRLNLQGSMLGFSTERSDALWWLMVSTDANANRLLLAVLDQPEWQSDMPRLVQGTLGRQQRGHWNTTVANAWGTLALRRFSQRFEATPVKGVTAVRYGTLAQNATWDAQRRSARIDAPWQDGAGTLQVSHQGTGAPWLLVQATAAAPLLAPVSTGYRIERTVSAIEQRQPGRWSRGDILRVRLDIDAQSDMSWVVVDDPVPGGASLLGTGLGGQSALGQQGERREGWVWPAFEERRQDALRAYYRWVPKGRFALEYTLRLDNPGQFQLPPTRVEAMYAPEMFGEVPNAALVIER